MISYHIISYHTISYHIMSYHIIYHISYIISYHTATAAPVAVAPALSAAADAAASAPAPAPAPALVTFTVVVGGTSRRADRARRQISRPRCSCSTSFSWPSSGGTRGGWRRCSHTWRRMWGTRTRTPRRGWWTWSATLTRRCECVYLCSFCWFFVGCSFGVVVEGSCVLGELFSFIYALVFCAVLCFVVLCWKLILNFVYVFVLSWRVLNGTCFAPVGYWVLTVPPPFSPRLP